MHAWAKLAKAEGHRSRVPPSPSDHWSPQRIAHVEKIVRALPDDWMPLQDFAAYADIDYKTLRDLVPVLPDEAEVARDTTSSRRAAKAIRRRPKDAS